MNWTEIRTLYEKDLTRLNAKNWQKAMEGLDELEAYLKTYFPVVYHNPVILADRWEYVRSMFLNEENWKTLVSGKCFDAVRRTTKILEPAGRKAYLSWYGACSTAEHEVKNMLIVFNKWLETDEGKGYFVTKRNNLSNKKDYEKILIHAIRPLVVSNDLMKKHPENDYSGMIENAVLFLIRAKIKDIKKVPVLLLFGNEDIYKIAKPFFPILKSLKIKIFAIYEPGIIFKWGSPVGRSFPVAATKM